MIVPNLEDQQLKEIFKQALLEIFEERHGLVKPLFQEVLEDWGLLCAIQDGEESGTVTREAVFDMLATIQYSDGPIEEVKVVKEFLPPKDLAFGEETVKVTIALSKASVEFFKQEASRHQVSYQKMIRRPLDEYTALHTS